MAHHWQLFLSPRPTQRTKFLQDQTISSPEEAILYNFLMYRGHQAVQETHYLAKEIVRNGRSGPPLHIHLRQTETFEVEQGVLAVVKNGVEYAVTKEEGPLSVAPGVRHTFWAHSSSTEDLIFKVWVEPNDLDHGFDERFMRNFNGYLQDCHKLRIAPSIFQILLFLYNADIIVTPPFWLPIWFLMGMHHILAYWVGENLLGYKASYPEYSN